MTEPLSPARIAEIEALRRRCLPIPKGETFLGDEYLACQAALRDLLAERERREWRPIETAPKVDPECPERGPLIFLGDRRWALEGWWSVDGQWAVGTTHEGYDEPPPSPPTHWRPLPEPPHE